MIDVLKEVVSKIISDADEAKSPKLPDYEVELLKDLNISVEVIQDYNHGRLHAYHSILKMIWNYCSEEEREAIGLDFDIDERYLFG